jgi:hypothetical protein
MSDFGNYIQQCSVDMQENITTLNFEYFSTSDWFGMAVNLFLLIFAKQLISKKDENGNIITHHNLKINILRIVSVILFACYFIGFFFQEKFAESWSQSYLCIITIYFINHKINDWVLSKYGDHKKVNDIIKATNNKVTAPLQLGVSITFSILALFILIEIWGMQNWVQTGSLFLVIGGVLFATKDVWLEEFYSSFVIISNGNYNRGAVISFKNNNDILEYFVILQTKFINTRLKNLKTNIETNVSNVSIVKGNIEIISAKKSHTIIDEKGKKKEEFIPFCGVIHFKIGYDKSYDDIKNYFKAVIEDSITRCNAISSNYTLNCHENGDHAVTWELIYAVNQPYKILEAKNAVNLSANIKQKEFNISLSTPITHTKINA